VVQSGYSRNHRSRIGRGNALAYPKVRLVHSPARSDSYTLLSFIDREDEELAQARQQRRPGRPPSKAEERISQRKEAEEREFRGGFWIPELRNEESRAKVEKWAGEWGGLNTLDFVRIAKAAGMKSSSFPPKASS
jgi:translation machinery-associated protein 16